MLPFSNTQEYINLFPQHEHKLKQLLVLLEKTALEETIKWKLPVYCINGKNVVGLGAFKNHISLWFFQGALLSDHYKVLENAQEGKTKAMRHWKFNAEDEMEIDKISEYLAEAIQNQKQGRVLKATKKKTIVKKITVPKILDSALKEHCLTTKFSALSPYKQKEFINYIIDAKRETTKLKRLDKILPLIASGKGLNDQYR